MAVNILDISNSMFRDRNKWSEISDSDKIESFFIFNRYFSKLYPEKSQYMNSKNVDKLLCMEIWFEFFKDKKYPTWMWSKSTSKKIDKEISDKDFKRLLSGLNIEENELNQLIRYNSEEVKEELKYFNSIDKNNK